MVLDEFIDSVYVWGDKNDVVITNIDNEKVYYKTKPIGLMPPINGLVSHRSVKEDLSITSFSMNKDEIDKAINNYLASNNIEKINKYQKLKSRIEFRANEGFFAGFIGSIGTEILISKIKSGLGFYPQMSSYDKDTQNLIITKHLEGAGCELIGGYKNSRVKISFRVKDGRYKGLTGKTSLSSIKRGFSKDVYDSLDYNSKKEYVDNLATDVGCVIVKYSKLLQKNDEIILISHYQHEWRVKISNLEKSKYCPHDSYLLSYGERIVATILDTNKIKYISQYMVKIDNISYWFDFYLPTINTFIEYDGVQHYKDINGLLEDNKRRDSLKNNYCTNNDINIIRIKYDKNSIDSVFEYLSDAIKLETKPTSIDIISISNKFKKNIYDSDYVLDYYKRNSYRKTVLDLGISKRQLDNVIKEYGFNKREVMLYNGKTTRY